MNRYRTRIQVFWLSARFISAVLDFVACWSSGRMCRLLSRELQIFLCSCCDSQRLAESGGPRGIRDTHCIYR